MSEHKTVYTKNRFPKQIAPGLCKGCHEPITNPRRTSWCNDDCKRRYDPHWVKKAVRERDRHICQLCGRDLAEERRQWRRMKPNPYSSTMAQRKAWWKANPKEEYDHIVPFCEGGHTVVENMRTLCHECHVERTTEWRKARKKVEKCSQ